MLPFQKHELTFGRRSYWHKKKLHMQVHIHAYAHLHVHLCQGIPATHTTAQTTTHDLRGTAAHHDPFVLRNEKPKSWTLFDQNWIGVINSN